MSPRSVSPNPALPDHVIEAYGLDGAAIELLGGGRTNTTLRARGSRDLVVQQLHAAPGRDLLGVMENLVRVTSHLDWRRRTAGIDNSDDDAAPTAPTWFPELVPALNGKPFLMDRYGDVWRAYAYRPGVIVRAPQPDSTVAGIARLYGRFAAETRDLGGPPLIDTAPGFHDLDVILGRLIEDLDSAVSGRRDQVATHLDRIERMAGAIAKKVSDDGLLVAPSRVVHNDTKFSNVLLDVDGGEAIAVLDLDLVMMGPAWHDVGDLLRSACWHQLQGPLPALSSRQFSIVIDGYVAGAAGSLGDDEIATFAVAGPRIGFELGLRYLNDHLRERPQLRVEGKNGHLERGLANLNLADEMFGAYDALRSIVDQRLAVAPHADTTLADTTLAETKGMP